MSKSGVITHSFKDFKLEEALDLVLQDDKQWDTEQTGKKDEALVVTRESKSIWYRYFATESRSQRRIRKAIEEKKRSLLIQRQRLLVIELFDYYEKLFTLPDNLQYDVKYKPGYMGIQVIPKWKRRSTSKQTRNDIRVGCGGLGFFIDNMRIRPEDKDKMSLVDFCFDDYPEL